MGLISRAKNMRIDIDLSRRKNYHICTTGTHLHVHVASYSAFPTPRFLSLAAKAGYEASIHVDSYAA